MFHVVSNPFAEMAQGVAENGLGYIAQSSVSYIAEKKDSSWSWIWWIVLPILIVGGIFYYLIAQDKKEKEAREKIEEEKQKLLEETKKEEITPV
jgi:phosphotransferase system  glucose/maltose/N-acetylglucosamine-specific IIC component